MYPLVTLVVPTLNGSDYILETVSSALAQDYPNLDILISDNGSRDETLELVKSVTKGDSRVRFRRNEATVPIYTHFNQCVDAARGEFLTVLDDDDSISPTFISSTVRVALQFPDVNVVVPRNIVVDDNGLVTRELATPDETVLDGVEFVCHWLYGRAPAYFASVGTVLSRTAMVRHFGGYQAFMRGRNIDNLLFLQCAISGRIGFAHDAVFRWRVYERSYSASPPLGQLASASKGFVKHMQRDPRTVAALAKVPRERREEIVYGVRQMAALELLACSKFYETRSTRERLQNLFIFPIHSLYYRNVLGHYRNRLLARLRVRRTTARADEA
jgi:glycosyltransferase involved in cell wall biosynthesis